MDCVPSKTPCEVIKVMTDNIAQQKECFQTEAASAGYLYAFSEVQHQYNYTGSDKFPGN